MPNWSDAVLLSPGGSLSVKHERIAEIIKDLDETLELAYIPEDQRSAFDAHPFAVIQRPVGAPPYVVMTMPENEVDHRVIAKLIARNTGKTDVLGQMDAENAALQLVNYRQMMDEHEEKQDFMKSVITSPKHEYRHQGVVYR